MLPARTIVVAHRWTVPRCPIRSRARQSGTQGTGTSRPPLTPVQPRCQLLREDAEPLALGDDGLDAALTQRFADE